MPTPGELTPEEYRAQAERVTAWIAGYLERLEDYPVRARVAPGEVRGAFPAEAPSVGVPFETILREFEERIVPGVTHWAHPRFFAYFTSSGSAAGILGETLSAALNVNGMLWQTSPAVVEVETLALDWMRQMMGFPESWDGHINDTASVSSLVALAAAREHATEGRAREHGLAGGPPLRVYTSTETHNSVEKAAITLGLGTAGVRAVPADEAFRMRADLLAEAIAEDRAAGVVPMAVVATIGTTSTTSVDPVPAIAEVCRREKVWLHVDAAYGGAMAVCPEHRGLFAGAEHADSYVMNPHKWLFVPIDCSVLWTPHPQTVRAAFSVVAPYLMPPEHGDARNLMDYGPALGRRFRGLKVWAVLRAFGAEGLAAVVRQHVQWATRLAEAVDAEPGWERPAPTPMGLVLLRHVPGWAAGDADDAVGDAEGGEGREGAGDAKTREAREARLAAHNREILERINRSGYAFLSHTDVRGTLALRVAIGNVRTTWEDVAGTWDRLREIARELEAAGPPTAG